MVKLKSIFFLPVFLILASCTAGAPDTVPDELQQPKSVTHTDAISVYHANPYYWQYKGKPVILLGGSNDDNLFQSTNLKEQLDLMQKIGANYIRNTMSGRDKGDVKPFKKLPNGKYDLNEWNDEYWNRFKKLLKLSAEREIFVQIELWDQWDHNENRWQSDPWNPINNVNYSTSDTQLKSDDSYKNVLNDTDQQHDFFLTEPKIHNDTLVLNYQKKFVKKILSISLQYDHVLYTVTNELFDQHPAEWSLFWINYAKEQAQKADLSIKITEMFQEPNITSEQHRVAYDDSKTFDFIDASQNSGQTNQKHWDRLEWVHNYISDHPRPINNIKIYGNNDVKWTGGDENAIERFWKNIIGGAASARFHRPPSGLGLSQKAQTQVKSARMFLSQFDIFKAKPDAKSTKLDRRNPDEAYLSYNKEQYAIYFPEEGIINLDLRDAKGPFEMKWLDIHSSSWGSTTKLNGGRTIKIATPGKGSWIALITVIK